MDIEVDDRDALGPMRLAGIETGHCNVVEKAKAHGAGRLRVMAAGPHLREGVVRAPRKHLVDRVQPGADGAHRRLPGASRQHRVWIEPHRLLARSWSQALDRLDVLLRVRERDHFLGVGPQRRLDARQLRKLGGREGPVEHAHAIGPLGMSRPRIVIDEAGVRDEQRRHAGLR